MLPAKMTMEPGSVASGLPGRWPLRRRTVVDAGRPVARARSGGARPKQCRGYLHARRSCACVQAPIPYREHQVRLADGQGAGKVYGVGTPERMGARQPTGVLRDGTCQLDRTYGSPVADPGALGYFELSIIEVVVAVSRGKCGAHLGICQPASQCRVT